MPPDVFSPQLHIDTANIIQAWLREELSNSKWVSAINAIKSLAEAPLLSQVENNKTAFAAGTGTGSTLSKTGSGAAAGEGTMAMGQNNTLKLLGIDRQTLEEAGVPPKLIFRLYRGLWVYSVGFHELLEEVSHYSRGSKECLGNIWKAYALLLEHNDPQRYVMAVSAVEHVSQRALLKFVARIRQHILERQQQEKRTGELLQQVREQLDDAGLEIKRLQIDKVALTEKVSKFAAEANTASEVSLKREVCGPEEE